MKFTIEVDMEDRWVPQFLGMLKHMERLGNIGATRVVRFYSDGDGDYNPKFTWADNLPAPADGTGNPDGDDMIWDAG